MSETKVFIHIGMHKTGTTFLQTEVFPKIPNINYQTKVDLTTKVEPGKINLFSDENLDGGSYRLFNNANQRDAIIENLHKMFPTAKIIICLRDKEHWLKSAWKQYIVAYYSCSFEEYCKRIDPRFLEFDEYVGKIQHLFGSENVYVCSFQVLLIAPETFVKNLCNFMEVKTPKFENKTIYKGITDGQSLFIQNYDYIFRSKLMHLLLSLFIRLVRNDPTIQKWKEKTL
jgi:hypothetical protein